MRRLRRTADVRSRPTRRLGAIHRKIFVWKTGFWGDEGQGWSYDLLYLVCNLVIPTTGGGSIVRT